MKAWTKIKEALLFCLFFRITYLYSVHSGHKPKACFLLSLAFLFLLGRSSSYRLSLSKIKKMLFPEVFAVSASICFLFLLIRKFFHLTIPPEPAFGLFIPLFLLGFAYLLQVVLKSPHLKITALKQVFVRKIYRRYPLLVRAYILASYGLVLGLVLAYGAFVFKASYYHLKWEYFGFLDKRYVFLTYLLFLVPFLFFPYFYCARESRSKIAPAVDADRSSSFGTKVLKVVIALIIATYFWGPPWNLHLYTPEPNSHETVHLGPILAIIQGKMPYTEALIQYGPGTQFFQYLYLKTFGLDLLHSRECFFLFHYVFALIFFLCVWSYLKMSQALLVSLFGLFLLSSLTLYGFQADGTPSGFFGWGVGFRYLAPPMLALAMFHQFTRSRYRKGHAFFVGCVYGFLLYMAQENFSCGLLTLVVGCSLAFFSRWVSAKEIGRFGLYLGLGVFSILSPVFVFYAIHNQLGAFIKRYFGVSSAVVQGFSNTSWSTGAHHPLFLPYILTPLVLFLIGFFALYRKANFTISAKRFQILLLVISAIALHQVSLFRADSSHFFVTLLTLPILFGVITHSALKQNITHALSFVFAVTLIYPGTYNLKSFIPRVTSSYARYFVDPTPMQPQGEIFSRFGFYKDDSQTCAHIKTSDYINEMKKIKEIVQDRSTIVDFNTTWLTGCTSDLYFFPDLKVGTKMIESLHSVINNVQQEEFIEEIKSNPIECYITKDLESKGTLVFLNRFPDAIIHERFFRDTPYFILLTR